MFSRKIHLKLRSGFAGALGDHSLKMAEAEPKRPAPITEDGERPQKRFYRSRAHCNPLSNNDTFEYPTTPGEMATSN